MLSLIAYYSSRTTLPTFQEAEFHHYCRPWLNPVLSDFCKKLTGIRQVSTLLFYYVVHAIMLHHCLDPYLLYIYIAITITHSQSMGTGCLCTSLIPSVWYTPFYWLRGEMQEDSRLCFSDLSSFAAMQDQVNKAPYFSEVFWMFTEWLESKELSTKYKFAVVTDWWAGRAQASYDPCILLASFPASTLSS